ncbi:MAG: outer membrane beta-barrel protein [Magnetococcales bacterium]|nr:outer membrane beta-barrel protein [Magnetococcales bacterium]
MKTTALGFAAMTLILPVSSHAVEVYAGGGVGVNHHFGTDPSEYEILNILVQAAANASSASSDVTLTSGTGKAFLGIRWLLGPLDESPSMGVELGYIRFGDQKGNFSVPPVGLSYNSSVEGLTASVTISKPLTEEVSLLGKSGALIWYSDMDVSLVGTATGLSFASTARKDSGISFTAGAGIEYDVTQRFSLRSEMEYFFNVGDPDVSMSSDIGLLSISGMYGF